MTSKGANVSITPFGKYDLLARIAQGGMAEVFRARFSPSLGVTKQVVIKRILPRYAADPAFIEMFTNEAKIAIGLSHGNIAQVFDFGQIGADWFLAMELVDGQPLSRVITRAREQEVAVIPTPFALLIAIELLKGLHYAHTRTDEHGQPLLIVHRDISPQNVLIAYEGQVKIVDFGIAKARTAGREETQAGAIKGKVSYFAPEQARGQALDARTDVFAAGTVLYQMLTGRLPFEGAMMDVLAKIDRGEFPLPREVNPALPPALEQIVLTAMAHEKAARYQTAEDFKQALSGYLYQHAPAFAPSGLGMFLGLLFHAELVGEGRPAQLPRDFLDQASSWRRTAPAVPAQETPAEKTISGRAPTLRGPQVRWPLYLGVAVAAAGLTVAGLEASLRWSSFSIALTSVPDHALVRVDGKAETQTTPVLLSDLSSARAHDLEISAPGMRRWAQAVDPQRGEVVTIQARLQPEPLAVPEPEEPPPVRPPTPLKETGPAGEVADRPQDPQIPTVANWPVAEITLEARKHAFLVAPSNAATLALDPRKTYRVWTEGRVAFGGVLESLVDGCVYLLDGSPTLAARDAFGIVGPKPITVRNARAIYAFIPDDSPADNSGAIQVRVMNPATLETLTLLVDGRRNTLVPPPDREFKVERLDPMSTYELTLKEGRVPARTRGAKGGPVRQVLFAQAPGLSNLFDGKKLANDAQRILEVGKPLRLTGTLWFWLAFPDLDLEDNDGTLVVEISRPPPK